MPQRPNPFQPGAASAARPNPFTNAPPEAPAESGSSGLLPLIAGGAALAGAGYLASKSGKLRPMLDAASALRQQLMLSGLAAPKSILGNIGATTIESMERGSMRPLKELFSGKTVQEAKAAWSAGTPQGSQYGQTLKIFGHELPTPGRFMGALDDATQSALQRAGLTKVESAKAVMQAPLPKKLSDALDSPAGRYLVPFRRTPFNQFLEGFETLKPSNLRANPFTAATVGAVGAAHGALTSDQKYPTSIGLGTALASKYGLPYAGAALLGRTLMGGQSDAGIMGTALPVSEYGLTSGLTEPLTPFTDPAALRVLKQLAGSK